VHHQSRHQADRVGANIALAAIELIAGIITLYAAAFGEIDPLAVHLSGRV